MNFLIFDPAPAACEEILTLNTVCSRRLVHVHKKTHHINMNKTFWLYGHPGSIKVMKYTNIKKYLAHHCRKLIPHNCQFSPVHLFDLWLNGEDTGNGGLKQSLDGSVTFVFPFMNPGKVCQIEEIYCSQWKLTWCWGRSRSTRWSPSPCRTHTPHSGYLSLLQSLGGAACSGVTTHTHTHTKLSLHSERFSDFQFGFGLIDTNTAMWEGCYRATVQRERARSGDVYAPTPPALYCLVALPCRPLYSPAYTHPGI